MPRRYTLYLFIALFIFCLSFGGEVNESTATAASLSVGQGQTIPPNNAELVILQGIKQVAVGSSHACALTLSGEVKCWGRNDSGQLGYGRYFHLSNTPIDVIGLGSGVSAISAGGNHTCALTTTGGVKCWGDSTSGQLGDGSSNSNSNISVNVLGLSSGVSAISAGGNHTCALTTSGGAKCWGRNDYGQLGNGKSSNSSIPANVSSLSSGVSAISAGNNHTCAMTTIGGVKCWGDSTNGQLGDGSIYNSSLTPVNVFGLSNGVTSIRAGGTHTCALITTGGVKCWGYNLNGQLGNGNNDISSTPVDVSSLSSGTSAITVGNAHTCALATTGGVKCWGRNNYGQLGNGHEIDSNTPVAVSGLGNSVAINAGGESTCALTATRSIKCWGYNLSGQLGNGSSGSSYIPVNVSSLGNGISAIDAGATYTCVVTMTGEVKCWGENSHGQLGNSSNTNSTAPVDVSDLSDNMSAISAGNYHTCALTMSGGVKCWGYNKYGQLGDGSKASSNFPVDVGGLSSGISAITVGDVHTCAVTTSGSIKCWGYNTNSSIPVDVIELSSGVSAISAGAYHTCALTMPGGVKCWGENRVGQLGNGTDSGSNSPVDVIGLSSSVSAISAGAYHTCALTMPGGVKCWGENSYGQLGNGTYVGSNSPVDVIGLSSSVSTISAGDAHTCALTTSGGVKCWGFNRFGEVGNGSDEDSAIPVDVSGLSSILAISAGGEHSCALTQTGSVKCWGDNDYGQLGTGNTRETIPVDVMLRCYNLTLIHIGLGNNPIAAPSQSEGCGIGSYTRKASISLTAAPSTDWKVASWSGTSNNESKLTHNSLIMPISNHTVTVSYSQINITCYQLSLSHTGNGDTPAAEPVQSAGCGEGHYIEGQGITLTANPASEWQITDWSGTDNDTSTSLTNTLIMTTTARTVNVNYQLKPWVVMIYLNGDNDLDSETYRLFQELEVAASYNPALIVRVLWDRSNNGDTSLYQVQPDRNLSQFANYIEGTNRWAQNELNMGDPTTLSDFIASTRQIYPTTQYRSLLAIVNHGGGWSPELPDPQRDLSRFRAGGSMFSFDQSNGYHYLSTKDMGKIFAGLQANPLDIVFYDACLMAMIEEAYEIRKGAHFFLASQYETWTRFPYAAYLTGMESRTAREQTHWMVDQYHNSLQEHYLPHTMAAIDLHYADDLHNTLDQLATQLDQALLTHKTVISDTFLSTQKLDYDYDLTLRPQEGYVDLGDFTKKLMLAMPGTTVATVAQSVLDVLHGNQGPYVYYERHADGDVSHYPGVNQNPALVKLQNATGISIYLPLGEEDKDLPFYTNNQLAFAYDTQWDDFIWHFKDIPHPQPPSSDYPGGRGGEHRPQPLSAQYSVYLPTVMKE